MEMKNEIFNCDLMPFLNEPIRYGSKKGNSC